MKQSGKYKITRLGLTVFSYKDQKGGFKQVEGNNWVTYTVKDGIIECDNHQIEEHCSQSKG